MYEVLYLYNISEKLLLDLKLFLNVSLFYYMPLNFTLLIFNKMFLGKISHRNLEIICEFSLYYFLILIYYIVYSLESS